VKSEKLAAGYLLLASSFS